MQDQFQRRKLLLADDSVTIQKVVDLTFADEGVDVVSVGDGHAALDLFHENSPDIVLADVNIPGLTGYEICAKIKAEKSGSAIPVVLLVGSFEPYDEEEAERVGADGYLTKPFQSISQLVDKVAELLGAAGRDEIGPASTTGASGFDSESASGMEPDSMGSSPTSFPNPFDEFTKREIAEKVSEPDVFEQELLAEVPGTDQFDDIEDFEMAEAFAIEETRVEVDVHPGVPDSETLSEAAEEIEEVSDDFLRTQPMTNSDLQEIAVDSATEERGKADSGTGEFPEWTRVSHEFLDSDEQSDDEGPAGPEDAGEDFKDIGEWANSEEGLFAEKKVSAQSGDDEPDQTDGPATSEKSFSFSSSERFEDPFGASNIDTTTDKPIENETISETGGQSRSGSGGPGEAETSVGGFGDHDSVLPETPEPSVPLPLGVSVLDLDEMNLLELPPADEDEEPEILVDTDAEMSEVSAFNGGSEPEQTVFVSPQPPSTEAENAASLVGSVAKTVSAEYGVSKELVEAITQRVVEVLSEKAIRDIAWEVVPDMAELILRKMAEEKLKN